MSAPKTFGSGANPTAAPNSPGQAWGRGRKPWAVEAKLCRPERRSGFVVVVYLCRAGMGTAGDLERHRQQWGHGDRRTWRQTEGHGDRQRDMETAAITTQVFQIDF